MCLQIRWSRLLLSPRAESTGFTVQIAYFAWDRHKIVNQDPVAPLDGMRLVFSYPVCASKEGQSAGLPIVA